MLISAFIKVSGYQNSIKNNSFELVLHQKLSNFRLQLLLLRHSLIHSSSSLRKWELTNRAFQIHLNITYMILTQVDNMKNSKNSDLNWNIKLDFRRRNFPITSVAPHSRIIVSEY